MSYDRDMHEKRVYEERISQLQAQNRNLRGSLYRAANTRDSIGDAIIDLTSRNQRLERDAEKYQREIKEELKSFIRESNLYRTCEFRDKYIKALNNGSSRRISFYG